MAHPATDPVVLQCFWEEERKEGDGVEINRGQRRRSLYPLCGLAELRVIPGAVCGEMGVKWR